MADMDIGRQTVTDIGELGMRAARALYRENAPTVTRDPLWLWHLIEKNGPIVNDLIRKAVAQGEAMDAYDADPIVQEATRVRRAAMDQAYTDYRAAQTAADTVWLAAVSAAIDRFNETVGRAAAGSDAPEP